MFSQNEVPVELCMSPLDGQFVFDAGNRLTGRTSVLNPIGVVTSLSVHQIREQPCCRLMSGYETGVSRLVVGRRFRAMASSDKTAAAARTVRPMAVMVSVSVR